MSNVIPLENIQVRGRRVAGIRLREGVMGGEAPIPFPKQLQLETTTRCNATCPICPNREMGDTDMPTEMIHKIIRDCKGKKLESIHPFFTNESFMDKRFHEIIEFINEELPETSITIYTNGQLLTEKNANFILDHNLKYIAFSIDGATKEVYDKVRPGLNFDKVCSNVEQFLEILANHPRRSEVYTKVTTVTTDDNIAELPAIQERWRGKVDEVQAIGCDGRGQMGYEQGLHSFYRNPRWACYQTMEQMYVRFNGECVLCCKDAYGMTVVGNAFEQSLEEIWLGEPYRQARAHLAKSEWSQSW